MNLKEAEKLLRAKLSHVTCDYTSEDQALDTVFGEIASLNIALASLKDYVEENEMLYRKITRLESKINELEKQLKKD